MEKLETLLPHRQGMRSAATVHVMNKRRWLLVLRLTVYVVLAGLIALWMTSEDKITEENLKRIQTGMTLRDVEEILGGRPNGIDKSVRYQPVDEPTPRYPLVWSGPLMRIQVVFDDDGKVISRWWRPPGQETLLDKIKRWLHLQW